MVIEINVPLNCRTFLAFVTMVKTVNPMPLVETVNMIMCSYIQSGIGEAGDYLFPESPEESRDL